MTNDSGITPANIRAPLVNEPLGAKLLPGVLSVIAGSTDVISFLGLGGLFTAHITGNLVILAAHVVAGGEAPLALMISVPVFIVVLALTRFLAAGLERMCVASLRPLLLLQFLLLAGFLALCVGGGSRLDSNAARAIVAGMLGVSAMAVQNALVQISMKGAPSTAVMTTNVTRFVLDLGEVLLGHSPSDVTNASRSARRSGLAIVGFVVGCGLGAGCQALAGLWALALPTGLGLVALVMAAAAKLDGAQGHLLSPGLAAATSPERSDLQRASAPETASNAGSA